MKEPSADVTIATRLRDSGAATPIAELLTALFDRDGDGHHLIDRLRHAYAFVLARDVLGQAVSRDLPPEAAELVRQQQALCLYKDHDLPAKGRLDEALAKLSADSDALRSDDPETLGIAGAISRRYWELDGHRAHLERALRYYQRGHSLFLSDARSAGKDKGYNGINAAFLEDQLAQLSAEATLANEPPSAVQKLHREQASRIRREVVDGLRQMMAQDEGLWLEWWVVATLIEAHFGLGEFEAATAIFEKYGTAVVHPWEVESTLKQLVALARLHGHIDPAKDVADGDPAYACLKTILGPRDAKLIMTADQKVGLALSGGGFRASFYEIGVLAALAEFDLLRHVAVLSTVSGGSVLGAHYYLEVQRLLTDAEDGAISRDGYVEIVKRVVRDFLAGVESNIRTRVVLNPADTLRMFFTKSYSRTMKAGELYEEHIYSKARKVQSGPIRMPDLLIQPKGEQPRFRPNVGNWQRQAKVPILVLNATSLNTGHNWQFTASWMGEPLVETDIDATPRMRRVYYEDLKGTPGARYADLRLGHAVAASACVPGLFEPLALVSLYEPSGTGEPGPTTVRLVDGGVHDNQGIGSLLEQDCNVLIVADASGQITYEPEPSTSALGGVLRSNSAMMARIREAQYRDVKVQREVGRRKGLTFVHLKEDLHSRPVNWLGCEQPKDGTENPSTKDINSPLTSYGIRKSAQEKIAALRTDLDSFSEIEAYSLMYSGYRATRAAIPKTITTLTLDQTIEADWAFLVVASALSQPEAQTEQEKAIEHHLQVGAKGAFKVWKLHPLLRILRWVILVGGGGALLWWTYDKDVTLLSLSDIWWFAVGALLTWALGKWIMKLLRPHELVKTFLTGLALTLLGWIVAGIHVLIFDPWFKRLGRATRL